MTATKPTQSPADRKLRLVYSFPSDGALVLGLVIVQGKRHDGYVLRCEADDFGGTVRWHKEGTGDEYTTRVAASGTAVCCSCPGYRFHQKPCRHMDAAETLAARGIVPTHA